MTYSSGSSGYQSAQPTSGSSGPSFAKSGDQEGKLPRYLTIAVVALGLLAYFLSYGPVINVNSDAGPPPGPGHHGAGIAIAALLAGLLAAVGLLPKARNYLPIVAVISVLGALMLIARAATLSDNVSAGWALWAILGLTVVQAIAAVAALLLARRSDHPADAAAEIRPVQPVRAVRTIRRRLLRSARSVALRAARRPAAVASAVRLRSVLRRRRIPAGSFDRRIRRCRSATRISAGLALGSASRLSAGRAE